MKKTLVILMLIISSFLSYSQNQTKIDSLMTELIKTEEDTNKIIILNKITLQFALNSNDSSLVFSNQAIELSEKLDYKKGAAYAYQYIGMLYYYKQYYVKSLIYYQKSIELFIEINEEIEIAKCYEGIAKIHYYQNNIELSIKYMKKGMQISEKKNNKQIISAFYNNLAILYQTLEKNDTALIYFNKSIQIDIQLKDTISLGQTYNNISNLYVAIQKYTLAEEYLKKSLKIKQDFNDAKGVFTAYANFAGLHNIIADSLKKKKEKEKNYNIAVDYAKKTLIFTIETNDLFAKKESYFHLINSYKGLENYKEALKYSNLFQEITDSIFDINKAKEIQILEAKYKFNQSEKEIKLLKENIKKTNRIHKNRRFIAVSLLFILIITIFFLYIIIKKRKQEKEKSKQLLESEKKIRNLTVKKETEKRIMNAVITTEENEKRKFASDLHDGLGPILSSINMYIEALTISKDQENAEQAIVSIQNSISEAIKSVQEISNNISPHILQNFGLLIALKKFCNKVQELNKIKIYCNIVLDQRLIENIEISIYRIFIELINNSLKHSDASEININIKQEKQILFANYSDNGIGFEVEKTINSPGGMGINNMFVRIKILSGTMKISSFKNRGMNCEIKLEIN